jgi:transcriptional regulator with XRE-family HTH domain
MRTQDPLVHAAALREFRQMRGFGKAQFAEVIGMNSGSYGRIESGERPFCRPATLRKIARTLNINIDSIVCLHVDLDAYADEDETAA